MSRATQFKLQNTDVIKLILKENNIRNGRWTVMFDFGIGPGSFGPEPGKIFPGLMVGIQGIGITEVEPGVQVPETLVVDASKIWTVD